MADVPTRRDFRKLADTAATKEAVESMEDELRRRIEATDTSNQIRSVLRDLGDLKTIDSKVESLTDDLRATAKDSHVEAVRGDLRRMSEANGEQFARMIESLQRLLDATVTLEDLLGCWTNWSKTLAIQRNERGSRDSNRLQNRLLQPWAASRGPRAHRADHLVPRKDRPIAVFDRAILAEVGSQELSDLAEQREDERCLCDRQRDIASFRVRRTLPNCPRRILSAHVVDIAERTALTSEAGKEVMQLGT